MRSQAQLTATAEKCMQQWRPGTPKNVNKQNFLKINNKDLLYSTWDNVQDLVLTYSENEAVYLKLA